MRTYHDSLYYAVLPAKLDAATASIEGKQRLAQMFNEATWRLNEAEAQQFAQYFDQYWQSLFHTYGERRCAGESDEIEYINRWNTIQSSKPDIHLGDLSRRRKI